MPNPATLHSVFTTAFQRMASAASRASTIVAMVIAGALCPAAFGAPANAITNAPEAVLNPAPADTSRTAPGLQVSDTRSGEPRVERILIEDSGSRIEEVRVRGQTRSIHVQPKGLKGAGYDIVPADPARDSAPGPSNGRGAAGQRVWSVWSF
jgi:hypothetical protein